MKHRVAGRQFGRPYKQRQALLKSLTIAFLQFEKIQTTEAKAKEIQPLVEKLISRAREDTLGNRREVLSALNNRLIAKKLFELIGPRYKERNGGYTRLLKIGQRQGDAAPIVQLEMV
jgi:large subunit ribosomal protein L17